MLLYENRLYPAMNVLVISRTLEAFVAFHSVRSFDFVKTPGSVRLLLRD
jgi:hypothetical protein